MAKRRGKRKVKINRAKIGNRAQEALDAYAKELDVILDRQFTDEKWNWPRRTLRSNGQWAEKTRDIIDTGRLMNSKIGPTKGGLGANYASRKWIWDTPYAQAVLYATGSGHLPRNWVKASLDELPMRAYVAKWLKQNKGTKK